MTTTSSKTILFVDDRSNTHAYYRDQLKRHSTYQQYRIELAFDLEDAIEILTGKRVGINVGDIVAVIVDLHLPGNITKELDKYHRKHADKIKLNEGQLLGLYLRDKNIPYFYLSAYEARYQKDWERLPKPKCLDKENSTEFISTLDSLHLPAP